MPREKPGQGFPGGQIGTRIGCDFQQVAGHRGWDLVKLSGDLTTSFWAPQMVLA